MNIILFDTDARRKLFPLTLTRAVADIRIGILTIKERWEKITREKVFVLSDPYLQSLYETAPQGEYLFVDARVIPLPNIIQLAVGLQRNNCINDNEGLIAGKATITSLPALNELPSLFRNFSTIPSARKLTFCYEIFRWNEEMISFDYKLITGKRISLDTNDTVHVVKPSQIFIEEGAKIDFSILNAAAGPIYIGKNATIMEGCLIRGPLALCEGAVLKMDTKIYGATTIGPYCTGGGEIKNSIMMGYSNKGHEGYLGDSVIGEWCNLGAGTSNSNVKNTGGEIKLWNYYSQQCEPAGTKCGVIMGDYSRTAINSSINTGTVIGVCCNVFGKGLTPKFIPDGSWGSEGAEPYNYEKALKDVSNWKKMKNKTLSEQETQVLKHIFARRNQ